MAQPIWITSAGSLGNFPSGIIISPGIQLEAQSGIINPTVTYLLLSGNLPDGLQISTSGVISGTPTITTNNSNFTFVVRATNNNNEIKDRSFSILISGTFIPKFTLSSGSLLETIDSIWIERQVPISNVSNESPYTVTLVQGSLPPGLEINQRGIIRGYPKIPIVEIASPQVVSIVTNTSSINNSLTCLSTIDFIPGRLIFFTGTAIGGLTLNKIYYVREIISPTEFTISQTQYGPEIFLNQQSGFMNLTLPSTIVGQPIIRTYNFDLSLESLLGNDLKTYSITVINQNLPLSRGGPGKPYSTRIPTILNTRPLSFIIPSSDTNFSYYLFPNNQTTYNPNQNAVIQEIESDNYFSFKILGYNFDLYNIKYQFIGLPSGLTGDINTGWIYGTPILNNDGVIFYSFSVRVYKQNDPTIQSGLFNFSLNVYKTITSTVIWITPSNLGTIFNNTLSTKNVRAIADVDLEYRIVNGELPNNLEFLLNGEITGYTSFQPDNNALLEVDDSTDFTFSVQAYSPLIPAINSTKTFTLTVLQKYSQPTDILYCRATPSQNDRNLINSLLDNNSLIPNNYLYRPFDIYFGKAKDVVYVHQYGVNASNLDEYLASVYRSFYLRNITLGPIKTALAKNQQGQIIYEVVYSQIIDNLVNNQGQSVNFEIVWPVPVNLNLGPWITSVQDINASYVSINDQNFYTSLSPGQTLELYPNSLLNMNKQIADTIGQQYDSTLLPLWMTSQQANGNTLGFTRAWVICYTKPGYANIIKHNIETNWKNEFGEINKLNSINFRLDRISVDKSLTYNYSNYFTPPEWTGLPSATPTPDPLNSKDFNVLFPRQTILPDDTQE